MEPERRRRLEKLLPLTGGKRVSPDLKNSRIDRVIVECRNGTLPTTAIGLGGGSNIREKKKTNWSPNVGAGLKG
jgi:hypothetical protein